MARTSLHSDIVEKKHERAQGGVDVEDSLEYLLGLERVQYGGRTDIFATIRPGWIMEKRASSIPLPSWLG